MMRKKIGAAILGAALATGCFAKKPQVKEPVIDKQETATNIVEYKKTILMEYCVQISGPCMDPILQEETYSDVRPEPLQKQLERLPKLDECSVNDNGEPVSLTIRAAVIKNPDSTRDFVDTYEYQYPVKQCGYTEMKQTTKGKMEPASDPAEANPSDKPKFEETR